MVIITAIIDPIMAGFCIMDKHSLFSSQKNNDDEQMFPQPFGFVQYSMP